MTLVWTQIVAVKLVKDDQILNVILKVNQLKRSNGLGCDVGGKVRRG